MLVARLDPAGVFVFGRRSAAVFNREPEEERTKLRRNGWPCSLASGAADFSWNFSALITFKADLFHLRRYAHADRAGLRLLICIGIHTRANSSRDVGADFNLVLGGFCAISGAARQLRLHLGRSSAKLGS